MSLNKFMSITSLGLIGDVVNLVKKVFVQSEISRIVSKSSKNLHFEKHQGISMYNLYYKGDYIKGPAPYLHIAIYHIDWVENLYRLLPTLIMSSPKNLSSIISRDLPRLLSSYSRVNEIILAIKANGVMTDDQVIREYKRTL
jgi:hypothetical protein